VSFFPVCIIFIRVLKGVGDFEAASLLAKTAGATQQKLLIRAATYFSENDLETYTYGFSQDLSKQFSLLAPETAPKIWDDDDGTYSRVLTSEPSSRSSCASTSLNICESSVHASHCKISRIFSLARSVHALFGRCMAVLGLEL
jgi:hypothetical protein